MTLVLLVKFTNLFNWVRFKTSTPMQSFRNRLFIERDSKQRRVMSNFGLTFRNSKWASYAQNNLNFRQNSTLKVGTPLTIIGLLSLVIVFLTQSTTFSGVFEYTFVGSLVDSMVESLFNSIEHFAIVFFITSSTLINMMYTKVFTTLFATKIKPLSNEVNNNFNSPSVNSSKEVSKLLFTAKLKNFNITNNSDAMVNIFGYQSQNSTSVKTSVITRQLYKAVGECVDAEVQRSLPNSHPKNLTPSLSTHLLNNKWSLSNLNSESTSREVNVGIGLYSMNNYSFRQLNKLSTTRPELKNLSTLYSNYINVARTDRWLYRYSMLHRKSLHKAHNLTLAKRLTSLGFFNASLASNNLWASGFIQNTSNLQNTLSNLYVSLYGNIWYNSTSNFHNSNTPTNPLTSLEFFETSYFWILKRFYLTNTLSNHHTSSNLQTTTSSTFVNLTNTQNHQTKLLRLNLEDKAIFITTPYNKRVSNTAEFTTQLPALPRDLVTTYFENGVLGNDNLTVMVWVYDDKLSNNFSYNFFNYNNYLTNLPTLLNSESLNNVNDFNNQPSTLQTYLDFTRII